MKRVIGIVVLLIGSVAYGQQDPAAKALLDEVSATTSGYENIDLDFSFSLVNTSASIPPATMEGSILIQGESYHLELEGNEQISDGERIWRVLPDDEVVETMGVDDMEEEGLTPSRLLTMYESGFKYKLGDKKAFRDGEVQLVYLFPENPEAVPYSSVELAVDTEKNQIMYLMENGEDGTVTTYEILTFETDVEVPAGSFTFDSNKYPGFEVIDVGF